MTFLLKIEKIAVLFFIAIGNTLLVSYILTAIFAISGFSKFSQFLYLLNFLVLFLILRHFWGKWSRPRLVIWTGFFIFLIELMFNVLSPARLAFPPNVGVFQIYLLVAPFILILPILGPLALVYAHFRGLLKNQSEIPLSPPSTIIGVEPEQTKKKVGKYVVIAIAAVIILIITFPAYYVFHTGIKDVTVPEDPLVGKKIILGVPLAYSRDCTGCGGSPRGSEINRNIVCMYEVDGFGSYLYKDKVKNITYVPTTMEFTVSEVYKPHRYGITSLDSGPGDYRMAVLKDTNGLLSTVLADEVESKEVCLNRTPSYLDKLFQYIETTGKAKIELALYDFNTGKSDRTTQQEFINSLPKQYSFSNINTVDSTFIPGIVGIQMDVDANALAFLVSSRLDLKIWEISGLDTDYKNTLLQDDTTGMRRAPIKY